MVQFKPSRHGSSWPAGYPWAWWSPSWRGWRKGWCPRTSPPGRPRLPPAGPSQQSSGTSDQSWSPEQSHEQDAGMVACGWAVQWTSSTSWSLERATLVVLAKAHIPEFFLAASLDDGEKILCQLGWQLDGHWTPVYKHLKIMISTVHNFKFTWMKNCKVYLAWYVLLEHLEDCHQKFPQLQGGFF